MKCTNKIALRAACLCLVLLTLTGCGSGGYAMPYDAYSVNSSFTVLSADQAGRAETFAADLCIANENYNESAVDMSQAEAAGLFSLGDKQTLYSKNIHKVLYPASLTKVMTALVALKNGNREDVLTASANVKITESGATLSGLKAGDKMTLDQALRILLLQSANDVAVMIAEQYGGTVEHFCEMMNEEAASIGATNCHFTNPHGLTDEEHYVTAYDMYLIFNEACKYELFKEIIGMTSYSTVYMTQAAGRSAMKSPPQTGILTERPRRRQGLRYAAERPERQLPPGTVWCCYQAILRENPIFLSSSNLRSAGSCIRR